MSGRLVLENLTRHFPGADAATLAGLDLEVPAGGCVALLGPSGSGKSTVLRLVAGLDVPDGGDVLIDGRSLAGVPAEARRAAMVFQRPRLFPHLSVLDNVAFPLLVTGSPKKGAREAAGRFLDLVGVRDLARRRPASLSGGQEQRVALARALAARPDVLLLDEPFSALDPTLREEMHQLLDELRAAVEPTILLVTHDRHEASVVADSIAVLLDGRIAQHDTPSGLHTRPASVRMHRFLGGRNAVPGTVVGGLHHSEIGLLALPPHSQANDGPGVLLIRQETLMLTSPDDVAADAVGTVRRAWAAGARTVVEVDVGSHLLTVEAGPGQVMVRGERTGVVIPVDQRHVVPATDHENEYAYRSDEEFPDQLDAR